MTQYKKEYISFETARLLKGKEFDAPSCYFYEKHDQLFRNGNSFTNKETGDMFYNAYPIQTIINWLTELGVVIEIQVRHNTANNRPLLFEYQWCVYHGMERFLDRSHYWKYRYECADDAIRYCLEHLI